MRGEPGTARRELSSWSTPERGREGERERGREDVREGGRK